MMLLCFLLTGLVGNYIAQVYTTENAELATANKIFSDYSKLMGDRYFAMRQGIIVLSENQKHLTAGNVTQVESRWALYIADLPSSASLFWTWHNGGSF